MSRLDTPVTAASVLRNAEDRAVVDQPALVAISGKLLFMFYKFGISHRLVRIGKAGGAGFGIVFQQVHEAGVPFGIVEPAALAVDLVRQPAGGDQRDLEVFGIALDGGAQRLPQLEAAARGVWGGRERTGAAKFAFREFPNGL